MSYYAGASVDETTVLKSVNETGPPFTVQNPPPSCSGNTAAGSGQTKHGGLNLTSLPDVVLEHLFKMLPVKHRGALASTCSRLSAIMHRPSVWTDVTIFLTERTSYQGKTVGTFSDVGKTMTMKYGQYFQRVTVSTGYLFIDHEAFNVLADWADRRLIKSMRLFIEEDVKEALNGIPKATIGSEPLLGIRNLIQTLHSDTYVTIDLPFLGHCMSNVLEFYSFSKPPKFRSLVKKLKMSQFQASENVLVETDDSLPSAPTAMLVSQFPALQELKLSMGNMSDALLLALADTSNRQCPLNRLALRHIEMSDIPQLSSAAWKKLALVSPSLTVKCCVNVHRLPPLSDAIKPETPLVEVDVCSNSGCKEVLELFELLKEHSSTLQNLEISLDTNDERVEEGLKNVVKACPRLRHLTCDMDIHSQLIMDLADDCRQWRTFRFFISRVITHTEEDRNLNSDHMVQTRLNNLRDFVVEKTGICIVDHGCF